jgi:hypothetical protein
MAGTFHGSQRLGVSETACNVRSDAFHSPNGWNAIGTGIGTLTPTMPTSISCAKARALLDSIDTSTPIILRDRALIALMVYSLARVGAALGMKGCLHAEPPALAAATREGWQGTKNAVSPQP